MAVTAASLKLDFPELEDADDAFLTRRIAWAVMNVDAHVFGAETDQAVSLLAAHYTMLSPTGLPSGLASEEGTTLPGILFQNLKMQKTAGYRLL